MEPKPLDSLPPRIAKKLSRYKAGNEQVVHITHRHWMALFRAAIPPIIVFILATAATILWGGIVATVLWWAWVIVLVFYFGWHWWNWDVEFITLTDKSVIFVSGVLKTKGPSIAYKNISDLGPQDPFLGKLLAWLGRNVPGLRWLKGYGTVRLETPGQHQDFEWVFYLPDADLVSRIIKHFLFGGSIADSTDDSYAPTRAGVPVIVDDENDEDSPSQRQVIG